jgi:hypothetical protein
MSVKTTTFSRIGACVGYLFEDTSKEDAIEWHHFGCVQRYPNKASRGLNRPCELSELMARTIAP